jgi:hypothetical protein
MMFGLAPLKSTGRIRARWPEHGSRCNCQEMKKLIRFEIIRGTMIE